MIRRLVVSGISLEAPLQASDIILNENLLSGSDEFCVKPENILKELRPLKQESLERLLSVKTSCYKKTLISKLNTLNNCDFSEQQWSFILDSWLFHVLSVVFDRSESIRAALSRFKSFYIESPERDFPQIGSNRDFYSLIPDDLFNQILYAKIARFYNIEVRVNRLNYDRTQKPKRQKKRQYGILMHIVRWFIKYRRPVLLLGAYFSFVESLKLCLLSRFSVLSLPGFALNPDIREYNLNRALREKVKVAENDEFDRLFNFLLPDLLPTAYLEGFHALQVQAEKISKDVGAIGSAHGIHSNVFYCFLCANVTPRGKRVIGFQHGGNYNVFSNLHAEKIEKQNSDKWYGWSLATASGMPSVKLQHTKRTRNTFGWSPEKAKVLLVVTLDSRFFLRPRIQCSYKALSEIKKISEFCECLDIDELQVRLPRSDQGWDLEERMSLRCNRKLNFDNEPSFIKSLSASRVCIVNTVSTTWMEALTIDVPVIFLIHKSEVMDMLPPVRNLFLNLVECGVVHFNCGTAVDFLRTNSETIESWWSSAAVVLAVDRLKGYLMPRTKTNMREWVIELKKWR